MPVQHRDRAIADAIQSSDAFIACLSHNAVSAYGVLNNQMKKQLSIAMKFYKYESSQYDDSQSIRGMTSPEEAIDELFDFLNGRYSLPEPSERDDPSEDCIISIRLDDVFSERDDLSENRIIPVRLDDCSIPISLKEYQQVNLFEETGFGKLVASLSQLNKYPENLGKKRLYGPLRLFGVFLVIIFLVSIFINYCC